MNRFIIALGLGLLTATVMLSSCKKNKRANVASETHNTATINLSSAQLADGNIKDMDAEMFNKRIVNLDKGDRKYLSPVPSVIDCYATWCGPCKQLAPIMEELAKEYKGKVAFYRVDVEKEPAFTMDLGVSAMPTLFFVNAGNTSSLVGFHSKEEVRKSIETLLKGDK